MKGPDFPHLFGMCVVCKLVLSMISLVKFVNLVLEGALVVCSHWFIIIGLLLF